MKEQGVYQSVDFGIWDAEAYHLDDYDYEEKESCVSGLNDLPAKKAIIKSDSLVRIQYSPHLISC